MSFSFRGSIRFEIQQFVDQQQSLTQGGMFLSKRVAIILANWLEKLRNRFSVEKKAVKRNMFYLQLTKRSFNSLSFIAYFSARRTFFIMFNAYLIVLFLIE